MKREMGMTKKGRVGEWAVVRKGGVQGYAEGMKERWVSGERMACGCQHTELPPKEATPTVLVRI